MSILALRFLIASVLLFGYHDFVYAKSHFQMYGEMARVVCSNPKYISMELLSAKPNRHSRYRTSFNTTTMHSWGNNVTLRVVVLDRWEKKNLLLVDMKICDILNLDWMVNWLLKYTTIPATTCPVTAGDIYGEMARVLYQNPKYLSEYRILSTRKNRASRYVTSVNITIRQAWGNNVTIKAIVSDRSTKTTILSMEMKVCDALQLSWVANGFGSNSDVPVNKCPVPAGSYHFKDIQIKVKDLPFSLQPGDFNVNGFSFLTKTKEKICEMLFQMRIN